MRVSCNGCRVLRKGCSDNCSIRPCLQWIKNPESQANATVFLAKFYGRAGLLNLINAGPDHLRPAMFRSLLYEACGRMVNPIYGSVGLLWSGSWQLCQSAVEAVLKGAPIMQIATEAEAAAASTPFKSYDIRHVCKHHPDLPSPPHKIPSKSRTRFKRSAVRTHRPCPPCSAAPPATDWSQQRCYPIDFGRALSHGSSASDASEDPDEANPQHPMADGDSRENDSIFSADTMEASHVSQAEPTNTNDCAAAYEDGEVELELALGFHPAAQSTANSAARCDVVRSRVSGDVSWWVELGLELPAV